MFAPTRPIGSCVLILLGVMTLALAAEAAEPTPLEQLSKQAQRFPKTPQAALELGRQLRQAALYQEALLVLRRGYRQSSNDADLLGQLKLEVVRTLMLTGKQYRPPGHCQRIEKVSPYHFHLCLAETWLAARRASMALPEAEAALELKAGYDALIAKSRALLLAGRAEEAQRVLSQAQSQDSKRPEALRHLAAIELARGNQAGGIRRLRAALALDASDPELRLLLAEQLGPGREARDLLADAVARRRNFGEAQALLADSLLALGHNDQALATLRDALRSLPQRAELHVAMARALLHKEDAEAALTAARKALQLRANDAAAKLAEAEALALKGDMAQAIVAFQSAAGWARTDPTPLVRAAAACLRAQRPATALAFAERASEQFPDWGPAWEVTGDVQHQRGERAAARNAYRRALKAQGPVDRQALARKLRNLKQKR